MHILCVNFHLSLSTYIFRIPLSKAATLGSQEGAFENVRLSFQGDQGQQLRQLLSSNAIRRVAMCALSSVKGHRQHLAVNHDKGKVVSKRFGTNISLSLCIYVCTYLLRISPSLSYTRTHTHTHTHTLSLSQITFLQLFPILRQTQSNRRKLTLTVSHAPHTSLTLLNQDFL